MAVARSLKARTDRHAVMLAALTEGEHTQRALAERVGVSRKCVAMMTQRPDVETYAATINNRLHRMYRLRETE